MSSKISSATFVKLQGEILSKNLGPLYFFIGDEPYFLDKLSDIFEHNLLDENEQSFNLEVIYGADLNAGSFVALARQYPVFAPYRIILVKEAQRIRKDQMDRLTPYLKQPATSTVVVFVYKSETGPDKRTTIGKILFNEAVVFESKRMYENQIGDWIEQWLRLRNVAIEPQALILLVSCLGANLQLIENELNKILAQQPENKAARIDKDMIYENINIDKEFNIFELINALGERNGLKSIQIATYLSLQAKNNPTIMIVAQLYSFYLKVAKLKQRRNISEGEAAKLLGVHPFWVKQYLAAARVHTFSQVVGNIQHLQEADLALKGISTTQMSEAHILKSLVLNLLH